MHKINDFVAFMTVSSLRRATSCSKLHAGVRVPAF